MSTKWVVRSSTQGYLDTLEFKNPVSEEEAREHARNGWMGKLTERTFDALLFVPS